MGPACQQDRRERREHADNVASLAGCRATVGKQGERGGPRAREKCEQRREEERADGKDGPCRSWANRPNRGEGKKTIFLFLFYFSKPNFEMQIQINLKFDFKSHN